MSEIKFCGGPVDGQFDDNPPTGIDRIRIPRPCQNGDGQVVFASENYERSKDDPLRFDYIGRDVPWTDNTANVP